MTGGRRLSGRILALCAVLAGCGRDGIVAPDGAGGNEIAGDYRGFTMSVRDAGFVRSAIGGHEIIVVMLTDFADVCAAVARGAINIEFLELYQNVPDSAVMSWTIIGRNADGTPGSVDPGPIAVGFPCFEGECLPPPLAAPPGGDFAFPLMSRADGRCRPADTNLDTTSTTIAARLHLTSVSRGEGGRVTGTFEIADRGQRLHGRFDARYCAVIGRDPDAPGC
jgi:hypothetical protein